LIEIGLDDMSRLVEEIKDKLAQLMAISNWLEKEKNENSINRMALAEIDTSIGGIQIPDDLSVPLLEDMQQRIEFCLYKLSCDLQLMTDLWKNKNGSNKHKEK